MKIANPVITAIDAGHFLKSEKTRIDDMTGTCRQDGETWPCMTVVKARRQHTTNLQAIPAPARTSTHNRFR